MTRYTEEDYNAVQQLKASLKPVGMFYTPKDREALNEWMQANCHGNPQVTTALMVGINYVTKQVLDILQVEPVHEVFDLPAEEIELCDPDDAEVVL